MPIIIPEEVINAFLKISFEESSPDSKEYKLLKANVSIKANKIYAII